MRFSALASNVEFSGIEALSLVSVIRISLLTLVLLLGATG